MLRRTAGFSFVEILVVIAALGIVAAISVPALLKARERSKLGSCAESGVRVAAAAQDYAAEHPEAVGSVTARQLTEQGYLTAKMACPSGQALVADIGSQTITVRHGADGDTTMTASSTATKPGAREATK